jgi:GT2 family glycosyltransferase/glycosyltransferase involved in cell wall biosynthesis
MVKAVALWLVFLPLQLALACLFGFFELLRVLRWPVDKLRPDRTIPPDKRLCSIVVLNWNGRRLLEEGIPPLLEAVRRTGQPHEVIVVDNGSEDDSAAWLEENHPEVRLLRLDKNYGFGEGNNRGAAAARHDIVVLLNNDMIVDRDFLPPLLHGFQDPRVFAVSSQIQFPKGKRREETGNTQGRLELGCLRLSHEPILGCHYSRKYLPVLWAGGGSSAFHRPRFLALGGFSSLFSPCYFEDTDLSYRAWRRGWKVLVAAHSRVLHKHRSSSAVRFERTELERLLEQRKLWYLWKNYPLRVLLAHFLLLPLNLTRRVHTRPYLGALSRLPRVLWSRLCEPASVFPHRRFVGWIRHPLRYLDYFDPDRVRRSRHGRSRLRVLIASAYLPHLGYHGGAGRVFQLLLRVSLKHEVSLLSFVETPKEREELEQVKPYCRVAEVVDRRDYQSVSLYPYEPFEEFNCPNFRDKLEELLARRDFDVVHFEWTQMAAYADLVRDIPKLVTEIEVNYAAHCSRTRLERNPFRRLRLFYNSLQTLYRELEMCRRVDRVVCVTDIDRDFLRGYLPDEQLCVVNTGVDTQYFSVPAADTSDPNAIVFVGAFRHDPNVDAMLHFCEEIFPNILSERPRTHLYIVGSSPPPSIERLSAHPNITVTGFVKDIRTYYDKARVVIVPLRTGVGIRGKILEGWSAGKAMVATPLACLGIRAIHGENIMIAAEDDEFALWTLALLRNPEHAARLGAAGRLTVEQFYDWSLLGEQMIRLYESLVPTDSAGLDATVRRTAQR